MKVIITYCSLPLIAAAIGWLTNLIAVKMIFRPRREIRFLGIRVIGLIPKRKHDLAVKIAETIEKELISHKDILAILRSEDFHLHAGEVIRRKMDGFIAEKLAKNPLIAMFVTSEMSAKFSGMIMEELRKEMPGLIDSLFTAVEQKINFRKIIQTKIDEFDVSRLESIVYAIAARELKAIELLGGVLGFAVGLAQLGIIVGIGNGRP